MGRGNNDVIGSVRRVAGDDNYGFSRCSRTMPLRRSAILQLNCPRNRFPVGSEDVGVYT